MRLSELKNRCTDFSRRRILQIFTGLIILAAAVLLVRNASTSFGGYFTSAKGSAGARVARYDVDVGNLILVSEDNVLDCNNENDRVDYFVEINNRSETEIAYRLEMFGSDLVECDYENAEGNLPALNGSAGVMISLRIRNPEGITENLKIENLKIRVTAVQSGEGGT